MTSSEQDNDRKERRSRLAAALGLGAGNISDWEEDDLAAALRQQLDSPLLMDLSALEPAISARVSLASADKGLLISSLRDLLLHPSPPVELLELVKNFAKAHRGHPEAVLPEPVASVLYFLSIAAGLVDCGVRLTTLGDRELADGLLWSARQMWVEPPLRDLLLQAVARIGEPAS